MEIKTLEVAGFLPALHGMRNPKNSWDKGDSTIRVDDEGKPHWILGQNDKKTAQGLLVGGRVHAKFLRQIQVWADIEAPIYWWSEFDTYKVGVTRDSCSTMHTLVSTIKKLQESSLVQAWLDAWSNRTTYPPEEVLELFSVHPADSVAVLSISESFYQMVKVLDSDRTETDKLLLMKKILPSSWLQRATVTMSYQNVRDMIEYRNSHRLPEWNTDFSNWSKTLPLSEELIWYGLWER